MDTILIFDFGSQTTQLIGRRIRKLGVFSEVIPGETVIKEKLSPDVKGIILSGSPYSVYSGDSPRVDPSVYEAGVPILGICFGLHRIVLDHGGEVKQLPAREFGRAEVRIDSGTGGNQSPLLQDVPENFTAWMSHGDSIVRQPEGFDVIGSSENHPAVLSAPGKEIYGFQFHPEVTHCEYGMELLRNFAFNVCGAEKAWSMETFVRRKGEELRSRVGKKDVVLLISGGVDSTVTAAILLYALDPRKVHLMYIDTGLMRKGETEEVRRSLTRLGADNLHIIDASEDFLTALEGKDDPEEKRRIIGDLFITIQEREIEKFGLTDAYLAQGTLYTDMIESGKGVGKKAHVIKSHHNVRSPLVEKKREKGLIIEPLDILYKDEVRELGAELGVVPEVLKRHPFPGPGLAVRILGEVTKEKCVVLRDADSIFIEELKKRDLYDRIWQAFCVLLPIKSVGVTGDMRNYGWVLALRAVNSIDGMTADVYNFETLDLLEISARITNTIPQIGRVVYDVSSKPPSTIEWE